MSLGEDTILPTVVTFPQTIQSPVQTCRSTVRLAHCPGFPCMRFPGNGAFGAKTRGRSILAKAWWLVTPQQTKGTAWPISPHWRCDGKAGENKTVQDKVSWLRGAPSPSELCFDSCDEWVRGRCWNERPWREVLSVRVALRTSFLLISLPVAALHSQLLRTPEAAVAEAADWLAFSHLASDASEVFLWTPRWFTLC